MREGVSREAIHSLCKGLLRYARNDRLIRSQVQDTIVYPISSLREGVSREAIHSLCKGLLRYARIDMMGTSDYK